MRWLAYLSALAIVVLTGFVHGDWSGRWGMSQALQKAADRLEDLPQDLEGWNSETFTLDQGQLEVGEIAGYVGRRYEHAESGEVLSVMIVCGRPGPISAHTPEWCYGGAGYATAELPATETIDSAGEGPPAAFWTNIFRRERSAVPEALQISWSWNAGQGWQAPDNARLAFAPYRVLYKMYIVRDTSANNGSSEDWQICRDFLRQFLPVVDQALFPRTTNSRGS